MNTPSPARQRIEALLRAHRLVLFMRGTPRSPEYGPSLRACHVLDGIDLDYAHVDVLADPALGAAIRGFGDGPATPRLYFDGRHVASGDDIERMANTGELHAALGRVAPARRTPAVRLTPAAADFIRAVIDNSVAGTVAEIRVDKQYCASLSFAPRRQDAIALPLEGGAVLQFDLISAQRGDGLSIDWQDVERGPSLLLHHPKAAVPEAVRPISPVQADARVRDGGLTIVDIRPAQERTLARLSVPFLHMDDGTHEIRNLPAEAPLAVLCHRGDRSYHAGVFLRQQGHLDVSYVEGGIQAWAELVDPSIARY